MKSKGLASPTSKKGDIVDITRKAFGKLGSKPRTLKQQMESLTEPDLEMVLQIAHMVKLSSVFHKETKPYKTIVDSMYPKMSPQFRGLVADLLEDAEPRGTEDTQANKRDNVISNTIKEYSGAVDTPVNDIDFSKRRSADEEKAEQLKDKILESLKLND